MRILSSIILAATIAIASPAYALVFKFELTGPELTRGGTGKVTGRILGLENNLPNQVALPQAADAVILDSVLFGDGSALDLSLLEEGTDATKWTTQVANTFVVGAGVMRDAQFIASSPIPFAAPSTQDLLVFGSFNPSGFGGLIVNEVNGKDFHLRIETVNGAILGQTFTPIPIPVPGAFGLLLTAIAGLGFLRRRKVAQA